MNNLGNKEILAKNLKRYMDISGKDRNAVCSDLKIKYTTLTDWINGNSYPRIDKIELLANYFGINKSDLIEDHVPQEEYYLDPEAAAYAQEIYEDPDLRLLFDASRKVSKDDLKTVVDLVKRMKGADED